MMQKHSSSMWRDNNLFSRPQVYEAFLCHNYQVYVDKLTKWFAGQEHLFYGGCGTGHLAVLMANKGFNIMAADINPNAIAYAHKYNSHKSINYKVMDVASNSNFSSNQFDGGFLINNTFRHLLFNNEIMTYLNSMKKSIKPGGLFINHLTLNHSCKEGSDTKDWHVNFNHINNLSKSRRIKVSWTVDRVTNDFTYESIFIGKGQSEGGEFTSQFQQKNWSLKELIRIKNNLGFEIIDVINNYGESVNFDHSEYFDAFVICKVKGV